MTDNITTYDLISHLATEMANEGTKLMEQKKKLTMYYDKIDPISTTEQCLFLNTAKVKELSQKIFNDVVRENNIVMDKESVDEYCKKSKSYSDNNMIIDNKNLQGLKEMHRRIMDIDLSTILSEGRDDLKKKILGQISTLTGTPVDKLKISHLDDYFFNLLQVFYIQGMNLFYSKYFNIKNEIVQKKVNDISKIISLFTLDEDTTVETLNKQDVHILPLIPYIYSGEGFSYQLFNWDSASKFILVEAIKVPRDFEQSDIVDYPNIRIFCTPFDKDNVTKNIFTQFTFLHEMGHGFAFLEGTIMKLAGKNVMLQNQTSLSGKKLEIDSKVETTLKKNGIEFTLGNGVFSRCLDIVADILATEFVLNNLTKLGLSSTDKLDLMIGVYKNLSSDFYHFETKFRAFLNIFTFDELKLEYMRKMEEIEGIGEIDVLYENGIFGDDITLEFAQQMYEHFIPDQSLREDFNKMADNIEKLKALENFNELKDELSNALISFDFDEVKPVMEKILANIPQAGGNLYYKKYLKYKAKYIKMKKEMNM